MQVLLEVANTKAEVMQEEQRGFTSIKSELEDTKDKESVFVVYDDGKFEYPFRLVAEKNEDGSLKALKISENYGEDSEAITVRLFYGQQKIEFSPGFPKDLDDAPEKYVGVEPDVIDPIYLIDRDGKVEKVPA